MNFDDFDLQIQCEEIYENSLDFIEFRGIAAFDEIWEDEVNDDK